MLPLLRLVDAADRQRVEALLAGLRLDPVQLAGGGGELGKATAAVQAILADVARRGDDAIVDSARWFDDPQFSAAQIRVTPDEMREAAARVPANLMAAIRR